MPGSQLRQGIFAERDSQAGDFLQALPAARDERLLHLDRGGIEASFVEGAFNLDRIEARVNDELGLHRIAADVPLGMPDEGPRFDQADDEAQIEIAVGDVGDFFAADRAEIALFAACHAGIVRRG